MNIQCRLTISSSLSNNEFGQLLVELEFHKGEGLLQLPDYGVQLCLSLLHLLGGAFNLDFVISLGELQMDLHIKLIIIIESK